MKTLASYGWRRWIPAMVVCVATVIIPFRVVAQTVSWDGAGDGTDWHDPDNWNPAGVPGTDAEVQVAADADILLTAETAELASFTMTGGTLTFSNWTTRLLAVEVDLQGGKLTHTAQSAQSTNAFGEWIPDARVWIVCSNLTVDAAAKIDVDERGYAREKGPGIVAGTYGGSYGGRGTGESSWGNRPETYGSVAEPTDPGSGGWSTVSTGGKEATGGGGGAIRIEASGQVSIHGTLTANGGHGAVTHASGGSGGGILITCNTFAGSATGLLSTRAGNGNNRGGPGGGGRIAVVYDSDAQSAMIPDNPGVRFNASQGTIGSLSETAEPGTIYFPDAVMLSGQMTSQWLGGDIHVPGFSEWSIPGNLEIAGKFGLPTVTNLVVADNLTIQSGGVLWLYSAPTNQTSLPYGMELAVGGELTVANNGRLILASNPTNGAIPWITCDRLFVAEGGVIDANYKGYAPHGESDYTGPGGGTTGTYGEGASHGGRGSTGRGSWGRTTQPYGDPLWPVTPGSAGGSTTRGGHGGGVIAIICNDTATIHGTLTANGYRSGSHGGTGSGGSILIACNTFHGSATGLLRARGGSPVANDGGGGSGGRIAVVYDPAQQALLPEANPSVGFDTTPGPGVQSHLAERGTLYLPDAQSLFLSEHMTAQWQDVDLIIPGGFPHWSLPLLQVDGRFNIPGLETLTVAGDLTVTSGGRISLYSHPSNTIAEEIGFRMDVGGTLTVETGAQILLVCDLETGASPYIECGQFDLRDGGLINANFWGFDTARGPGRGINRAGGGYGGAGSRGADGAANAGPANGVAHAPIHAGSGGGDYGTGGGGRGGGAVRIGSRGAMTIDGTISANGMYRFIGHAGSGSGGGILLSASAFTGSGIMRANGASTSNNGGAGGGGRIAVWTPFMPPAYLRQFAKRDLPAHAEVLDPEVLYPDLDLSVAAGTGGENPEEAEAGTIFFGKFSYGSLIMVR